MKLEFDNIDEMVAFLKHLGYNVEQPKEVKEDDIEEKKDDLTKNIPQVPYPYMPTSPYTPWYPNYPIVTYETMKDPNLSSKFGTCKK